MIICIITGGVGSRLWPVSRKHFPKPFINFFNDKSLFQLTIERVKDLSSNIINISGDKHFEFIQKTIEGNYPALTFSNIIEPEPRGSAAAVLLSCLYARMYQKDNETILVLPADHIIDDVNEFYASVKEADKLAAEGKIVVFGINPTEAATAYGYINFEGNKVLEFVEKPSQDTANKFFESGNYLWNSGMFCFKPATMIEEFEKYCPQILEHCSNALKQANNLNNKIILNHGYFVKVEIDSIDYAIMEKSKKVAVVKANFTWADMGDWKAISEHLPKDSLGNSTIGENVHMFESKNSLVLNSSNSVVGAIGIEDMVIVHTPDALLVASKDKAQDVKKLVGKFAFDNPVLIEHITVYRPWGSYTILDESNGFKVKRIVVKPGCKLSLQSHKYRSENWTVVEGIAKVTNNEDIIILNKGEAVFINVGNKHRLENEQTTPLTIIEVQTGSYLGEDDIVRYDDIYGRV